LSIRAGTARLKAAAYSTALTIEKIIPEAMAIIDHCGEARPLAEHYGVRSRAARADRFWIADSTRTGRITGIRRVVFEPIAGWSKANVTVGELTLDVYHTPGHTPGACRVPSPAVEAGPGRDVLFQDRIGRTDFRWKSPAIARLDHHQAWPLGDDTVFIPGHGRRHFAQERRHNMFVQRRGDAR